MTQVTTSDRGIRSVGLLGFWQWIAGPFLFAVTLDFTFTHHKNT